eukprot:1803940-Rhodomonas_salina.1
MQAQTQTQTHRHTDSDACTCGEQEYQELLTTADSALGHVFPITLHPSYVLSGTDFVWYCLRRSLLSSLCSVQYSLRAIVLRRLSGIDYGMLLPGDPSNDFNPREMANTAWGLAKAQVADDIGLWEHVADAIARRGLSRVAPYLLYYALATRSPVLTRIFYYQHKPQEIANTAWAFAT